MWMLLLTLIAGAHEMPKNLSSDLVFSKDGSIMPLSLGKLNQLASALKEEPGLVVEIRVHSALGPDADAEEDLAVTRERAEVLRTWFIEHGVPKSQIKGVGVGSAEPISDNRTASGRARNRRVEFKMLEDAGHAVESSKEIR